MDGAGEFAHCNFLPVRSSADGQLLEVDNTLVAVLWGSNFFEIEGGIIIRAESFSLDGGAGVCAG